MFSVIRIAVGRFTGFFRGAERTSPEDLLYAAKVLLWVRWFGLTAAFVEIHYRIDYGSLSHILNMFYCLAFMAANGYVQYLIRRRGTVKPVWLFVLSALDVAAISFSTSLSGGFNSPYFAMYYFAVAVFAYVFTSPRLFLPWTTLVVLIYSVLSVTVEPGLDIAAKEEQHLFYRVVALYAVSAAVGVIASLERESRRRGLERERELQRQRIEISQTIHDTTAQWAYMIGLGVEQATEMVDESQEALMAKLRLVSDLSRSAMWELRHPIDGGQIFRGEELGEVLEAHAATFTIITSVPAELVRLGREPPLSTIDKSLLFSMAHNALTNVIRHAAGAGQRRHQSRLHRRTAAAIGIRRRRGPAGGLRDKGPRVQEHAGRCRAYGRKFLEVRADGDGGGTTVACIVPYRNLRGGE